MARLGPATPARTPPPARVVPPVAGRPCGDHRQRWPAAVRAVLPPDGPGAEVRDHMAGVRSAGNPAPRVESVCHPLSAEEGCTAPGPRPVPSSGRSFPVSDPTEKSAATFSPPAATEQMQQQHALPERMDMQETRRAARQRRRIRGLMVGTSAGLVVTALLVGLVMTMQSDGKEEAGPAPATAVANSEETPTPASAGKKSATPSPSATPPDPVGRHRVPIGERHGLEGPRDPDSRRGRRPPRGRLLPRPPWSDASGPRSPTRESPRSTRPAWGTVPARSARATT